MSLLMKQFVAQWSNMGGRKIVKKNHVLSDKGVGYNFDANEANDILSGNHISY